MYLYISLLHEQTSKVNLTDPISVGKSCLSLHIFQHTERIITGNFYFRDFSYVSTQADQMAFTVKSQQHDCYSYRLARWRDDSITFYMKRCKVLRAYDNVSLCVCVQQILLVHSLKVANMTWNTFLISTPINHTFYLSPFIKCFILEH